jgi:hypothetical protein
MLVFPAGVGSWCLHISCSTAEHPEVQAALASIGKTHIHMPSKQLPPEQRNLSQTSCPRIDQGWQPMMGPKQAGLQGLGTCWVSKRQLCLLNNALVLLHV